MNTSLIYLFRQDLDQYPASQIERLARKYQFTADNLTDLKWMIAITHAKQKAQMPTSAADKALIYAAYSKNLREVQDLLAAGEANPGAQSDRGTTPLMYAVGHGDLDMINVLLATGKSNPGAQKNDGTTALRQAIGIGDLNIINTLLATGEANPGAKDNDGRTALWDALTNGDLGLVNILLATGEANPGAQDNDGYTTLMAAIDWKQPEIALAILKSGEANPGAKSNKNETALLRATAAGYSKIVKDLLATGESNPSAQTKNGMTALMHASKGGYLDIVKALIASGEANPGAQDENGVTALMYATKYGYLYIVKALLATGESNPGAQTIDGVTALMGAISNEYPNIALEILESGRANPSAKSSTGATALSVAKSKKMRAKNPRDAERYAELEQAITFAKIKEKVTGLGYTLGKLVGKGASGRVYLAENRAGDKVVVKFIPVNKKRAVVAEQYIPTYLGLLKNTCRPDLTCLLDYTNTDEYYAFVNDYIRGKPLNEVGVNTLSLGQKISIALDMATAIKFMHDHGVAHRDIKPGNTLVLIDPYVKTSIIDMDMACIRQAELETWYDEELDDKINRLGCAFVGGTPNYIAPELLESRKKDYLRKLDPLSMDIYSLGVTFYYIFYNKLPFGYCPDTACLYARKVDPSYVIDISTGRPELDQLIREMMAINPEQRPTIGEIEQTLVQVLDTL